MAVTYVSSVTVANRILDRLNEHCNQHSMFFPEPLVVPVFAALGMKNTGLNRTQARRILDRLYGAGHVIRTGEKSQHKYQISPTAKADGWDRSYPFNNSGGEAGQGAQHLNEVDDEVDHVKEEADVEVEVPTHTPSETQKENERKLELIRLSNRVKELEKVKSSHVELISSITKELEAKENRLDQLEKMAATASQMIRTLKIERYDGKVFTLKNVVLPSYFSTVLDLAKQRRNIMLVGPAGCGKTTVAELVAKTLGMVFGKVGGSGGLTETHLLGHKNQNLMKGTDKYRAPEFVVRFEQGGVMLIDELDGADQNVLLVLNPALDRSGMLPLVNRLDNPIAKKHKDFVCIATANTFGTGSNRIYAGRNQLDASTLSRFRIGIVECGYDPAIEEVCCPDKVLRERIQTIRRKMDEAVIRQVIDTRFMEDAYVMKTGCNWSNEKIVGQLLAGWSESEKSKVLAA